MLAKQKVFGPIVRTPEGVKPIGYIWIFAQKQIKNGEIIRYKAQFVAQGFSEKPNIDLWKDIFNCIGCNNITIFNYPSCTTRSDLMDDVTSYLYGSLENDIYMKIPRGFNLSNKANSKDGCSIKLNKTFYWLKQTGHVWYNFLIEYLLKERYKNDPLYPCIYMKILENEFAIIIVYVDDINIVGTLNELPKAIDCSKKEFEMNDLWRAKSCLKLEIEYLNKDVFIHQQTYIIKVLKMF